MQSVGRAVICTLTFLSLAACSAEGVAPRGGQPSGSTMDAAPAPAAPPPDTGAPPPAADSAPPTETPADGAAPGDSAAGAPDGGPPVAVDAPGPKPDSLGNQAFTCSWVLGIHTTQEWYVAGFEKIVDDGRWQVSGIEMAQFEWANPNSNLWNSPITSPCTMNSKTPDRIVFNGVDGGSTTVAQFLPQYLSVIKIIKTRFPSVKRVDLTTLARAPGNMECKGANRSGSSWIRPGQDEAIAMMVAMFPGFVFSTPKWEVKACSDFGLCPHISAAANADLARTIGEYFLTN